MPRYERILPLIAIIVVGLGLILLVEGIHALTVTIPLPNLSPAPAWEIATVSGAGDVGSFSSLALDRADLPHIAYCEAASDHLRYARFDGATWMTVTVTDPGTVASYTSLALDVADRPHISYYDAASGALNYARFDGSSWVTVTVDDEGDVGLESSLVLDAAGLPHISYYDATNGDLRYARFDGTSWLTLTVDSDGDVGRYTSLALLEGSLPHIAYYDVARRDLRYALFDGEFWAATTVDSVGDVGAYNSLVLDAAGLPRISYYDATSGDLKYARFAGSTWLTLTVDSDGDVGRYTSLHLNSDAQPYISYYDADKGSLRYACIDDGAWTAVTVDSTGDVGYYTSLALERSGQPHIAYYDLTSGDLKHASIAPEAGFEAHISIAWLILFFLLVVMAVGVEVLYQEEGEEDWALPLTGRRRPLHPASWIIPVLLILTAFLFLRLLQSVLGRAIGLVVVTGLLLIVLIAQHYSRDERPRARRVAYVVLDLFVYTEAFFLYGAIYTLRVRSLFSATTIVLFSFLLALALLHRLAPRGQAALHAACVGLCVGEVTWPLNYWAISGMIGGGFLLIVFYVLAGLARQHLQEKLTVQVALEYIVVGLLLTAPVVVYAFWPLLR